MIGIRDREEEPLLTSADPNVDNYEQTDTKKIIAVIIIGSVIGMIASALWLYFESKISDNQLQFGISKLSTFIFFVVFLTFFIFHFAGGKRGTLKTKLFNV